MENWRMVWREGLAHVLSTSGLESLWHALRNDDPRLTQGSTVTPPPLLSLVDCPCDGADAIGWCGWQCENLKTVGEVEEYFARICYEVDQRMQEPAACRWFLNWFDDTPRSEMRAQLLEEVERTLAQRFAIVRLPNIAKKYVLLPYNVGDKLILLTDQRDDNDNGKERITPAGSTVVIKRITPSSPNPYMVVCPKTGGWWFFSTEELDRETRRESDQTTVVQGESK